MNIQKKLICSLAVFLSFGAFAEDVKWGITLGTGAIEFESEMIKSGGQGAADNSYTDLKDASYTPLIFGIDVGKGKHSFSYKITSSGTEELNYERLETSWESTALSRSQNTERDQKETTLTYQYQLGGGWGLGIQYNDVESKNTTVGLSSYQFHEWNYIDKSTDTLDGFGFFGTYVKPIPDSKWVFAAKLGAAMTDYERDFKNTDSIALIGDTYSAIPNLVGSTISNNEQMTGDSTAAIIGFTMAYVMSPKSVLYFNYDTRTDDFGELTLDVQRNATGYFEEEYGDFAEESLELETEFEETNWKFSVEWRYALN